MFFLFTLKKIREFSKINFFTKLKTSKTHFFKLSFIITFPMWSRGCPTKNLGPIGPAVLTYILDTNKQTDKPNLYIDMCVSINQYIFFIVGKTDGINIELFYISL